MDIAFIVGARKDIAKILFKFEMDIVKSLIDRDSTPIATRYGLITYGNQASTRMSFGDFQDKSRMKQFLDLIQWSEDGTALNDALQKAQVLFEQSSPIHSRKLLVIFLTSPTGNSISELEKNSRKLRENGVNILVIPIGSNVDNREISGITSREDDVIRATPARGTRPVVERAEEVIKSDPCIAVDCDYYGICVSNEQRSTSCVCKQTYPDIYRPVCGSDLKTYSNLDAMKVTSCRSRTTIKQRSDGECSKHYFTVGSLPSCSNEKRRIILTFRKIVGQAYFNSDLQPSFSFFQVLTITNHTGKLVSCSIHILMNCESFV